MLNSDKRERESVDLFVEQFWKQGFMTVSRRFGTYLPEPDKVGNFEVDIVARQKKSYAIGIILSENDFNDPELVKRITFLASRQTRYTNKPVLLFIGVNSKYFKNAKSFIELLGPEVKKNIRLVQINERPLVTSPNLVNKRNILFS
jgi:hypothetical protein